MVILKMNRAHWNRTGAGDSKDDYPGADPAVRIRDERNGNLGASIVVPRRVTARLPSFTSCLTNPRGFPVIVRDDSAELAPVADLAHGLWAEVRIEHVVAELPALMRPLGVIVIHGIQQGPIERGQPERDSGQHRVSGFHRDRCCHENDRENGGQRRVGLCNSPEAADGHVGGYSFGPAQQTG